MSLFENPRFIITLGLEDTADIRQLHEIAIELGLLDWQVREE